MAAEYCTPVPVYVTTLKIKKNWLPDRWVKETLIRYLQPTENNSKLPVTHCDFHLLLCDIDTIPQAHKWMNRRFDTGRLNTFFWICCRRHSSNFLFIAAVHRVTSDSLCSTLHCWVSLLLQPPFSSFVMQVQTEGLMKYITLEPI